MAGENIWETGKEKAVAAADWFWERASATDDYWLVRFLFLRLLGFTYLFAFLALAIQVTPLFGSDGILPIQDYLAAAGGQFGSTFEAFIEIPSVLWFNSSGTFMLILAWTGVLVSLAILIGYVNVPMLLYNWSVYMSFIHTGQIFYSYGWETQLLETTFLALFLVPLWDPEPFDSDTPPPFPIIWLVRWLAVRIYVGAGLIKVRGDQCWRDLTCLDHHFETQPIPNPFSPWLHHMPDVLQKLGVAFNHFIELVAPFFVFLGRNLRNIGGVLLVSLQILLLFSGNLSFLNWLTLVAAVGFFDDGFLARFMPDWLVEKAEKAKENAERSKKRTIVALIVVVLIAALSVPVVANLLSDRQAMNASFNQLHLVNTYGAFGSVTEQRHELIVQGTRDTTIDQDTAWKTYDFRYKPDSPDESLYVVAPYQPRIAWQMWFAGIHASRGGSPAQEPWLMHLVWKLLQNDEQALDLVKNDPFPDEPPNYIRIQLYEYDMQEPWKDGTWNATLEGTWLPPVSTSSTGLYRYVQQRWG